VFLSKIWFFLVAVAAAAALTIALLLPRPAQRQQAAEERQRVITACDVVNILLRTNARSRIDLAGKFARSEIDVGAILGPATSRSEISADAHKTARTAATQLMDSTTGAKPNFVFLLDGRGRVVARAGLDAGTYGDTLAGYYLVDDALDGYLRDDLWLIDKQLYLVAASPVINRGYAGAVVIGHQMNKELAEMFVKQLGVDINFYADSQVVAASSPASVHKRIVEEYARVGASQAPLIDDCRTFEPFAVDLGKESYTALLARLPGEAGERGAFYSVFVRRPEALGLMGTLTSVKQDDLSLAQFPWIPLGVGFLVCVAIGMVLMIFEADRPLRRLNAEAIILAQGDRDRLDEDRHRGKFGSIARSVNIRIDKIEREARAKKTDLDELLGPASASALPFTGLGASPGPAAPPPPSQFKFTDSKPQIATPPPVHERTPPPVHERTPPPVHERTPPPVPRAPSVASRGPDTFDAKTAVSPPSDDLLAASAGADDDILTFRRVFDQFVVLKTRCGESTDSLTFEKFATKLRNNRDALMAKHACSEVRFEVYVKDGKAALKATPVKD
jgi:hypothetical protein